MKASYRWLRALLPGLEASADEVARRLIGAGVAVDALTEFGAGTADVVVAAVAAIEPHPSRPKLRLVTVDLGGRQQRVVCGALNVPAPGGLVAFAPLGATLPAVGMTLVPRDIGGVVSEGMLCSEIELGLTTGKHDDDPGIVILVPGTAKPGTKLRDAVPAVSDVIFELDLTPNRPDALGHIGIARDLAVLFGLPFGPPTPDAPARVLPGSVTKEVEIVVEDTERCPHYGAAMVANVAIGPSPDWLRYRLESLGVRPISNIVDVTNLVLLEFGHPMHAFDFDKVSGKRIVVRRAKAGEKLKTLDGEDRTLSEDDLVIADAEKPLALAGIMGGASSEISAGTKRVLLECAYFTPRGVRRSARRHAIHSESSHRFERGVDPADVLDVLAHAASLVTQLASGSALPGSILAGSALAEPKPIVLRSARVDALIGAAVPFDEARKILGALGFAVGASQGAGRELCAEVTPPTFRPDVLGEADLVDEILRVRGLGSVEAVLPAIRPQAPRTTGQLEARVRRVAVEVGLSETMAYSFVSPKQIAAFGLPPAPIVLKNPLSEERSVMRTTLLPGLVDAAARAQRHGVANARLFQVGARFLAPAAGSALPTEARCFAAVVTGSRDAVLSRPLPIDVYDAKGIAVAVAERVSNRNASVRPSAERPAYLHPRAAGDVLIDGALVGLFGLLHPDVAEALDVPSPVAIVEIDLEALASLGARAAKYAPIPTLPASTRDLAIVVHDDVTAGSVADVVREAAGALCESVELFDLFRGGSVPVDHRSLAFHVVYRDPKSATDPDAAKTLKDEEVDRQHQAVVTALTKRFGATLRS